MEKFDKEVLLSVFQRTAKHILKLGFRVFIPPDEANRTCGYYSDGTHIAYFQVNEFRPGVNIATCNKTPGSFGMHYILEPNNEPVPLQNVTKEYLEKGFAEYPEYFSNEDRAMMYCIKFHSLKEFLESLQGENLHEIQ